MFSLYSAGYIFAAICTMCIVPRFGWQWAFGFAIIPAIVVFVLRRIVQELSRFKHAQAEIERLVKARRQAASSREHLVDPRRQEADLHRLAALCANACGYWGITVFLTTFMVQKFHVTPVDAIFYAMMFYVVQFFLSYVGTGLSDLIGRRPAGILGALIMMGCTVVASRTEDFQHVPDLRRDHDRHAGLAVGCRRHLSQRILPHHAAVDRLWHHGRRRPCRLDLRAVSCRLGHRRVRADHSVPGDRRSLGWNHHRLLDRTGDLRKELEEVQL